MAKYRWTVRLLAGLVLAGSASALQARGGRPTAPPPDGYRGPNPTAQPTPAPIPVGPVSVSGIFEEMVQVLKFSDGQKKNLDIVLKDREKALQQYDKETAKELANWQKQMEKAPNETARTAIQRQLDRIAANKERLEKSFVRRAMALFSSQQKPIWASHVLLRLMTQEFAGVSLSEEQNVKLKALCDQSTATVTNPDVASDKALIDSVRQSVYARVLTDEQRPLYLEIIRQRQAATQPAVAAP